MSASVYIIYSSTLDKYYVGLTTIDVSERLRKHNHSLYGKRYTSQANDWVLMIEIPCKDYTQARKIELYIKRMKSRTYIKSIIENKTVLEKIIEKC